MSLIIDRIFSKINRYSSTSGTESRHGIFGRGWLWPSLWAILITKNWLAGWNGTGWEGEAGKFRWRTKPFRSFTAWIQTIWTLQTKQLPGRLHGHLHDPLPLLPSSQRRLRNGETMSSNGVRRTRSSVRPRRVFGRNARSKHLFFSFRYL